jgi:hypothetical protein
MVRMKKRGVISGVVISSCTIVVAIGLWWFIAHARQPFVSATIRQQVTSVILIPTGSGISLQRSSIKYDPTDKLLSFTTGYEGQVVTISEQPSPEVFGDVPDFYTKWLTSFGQYESFNSTVGSVNLARSAQLSPYSVAILNTKGTLLFAKPSINLSDDAWRRYFLALQTLN